MNIFDRVQKLGTIGEALVQDEPLLNEDREFLGQMLVEIAEDNIDEKLVTSIGRKIIIQAVKDLISGDEDISYSAVRFFTENQHENICKQAGIPAEEIHASVLAAVEQTGIRRMKLVGDILKELHYYEKG